MITVFLGEFIYRYNSNGGRLYYRDQAFIRLSEEEARECNKSNKGIEKAILTHFDYNVGDNND